MKTKEEKSKQDKKALSLPKTTTNKVINKNREGKIEELGQGFITKWVM